MRVTLPAFYLLLITLFANGCIVDKDDPTAAKPNANWVLAGQNFSSLTNSSTGTNVHFTNGAAQGIWARFTALPNGSIAAYKIIKGPVSTLASNEMVLQIDNGANESWYSTGEVNKQATVSKDFYGDITVIVPLVTVKHFTNGVMQNDSTTASAVLFYKKP
jgi:hypothetical protein